MRALLISCYELGQQPLALASAAAHLEDAGVPVECLDLSVQPFDEARAGAAEFIGISIPMHTATRLGVRAAARVRELNPEAHVCFYGLYAPLNAPYLLETCADSVIGGEFEAPLVAWARHLMENGEAEVPEGVWTRSAVGAPYMGRQSFRLPARHLLPPLERYARLEMPDGARRLVGRVEASRGCAHRCRHCPIPPVYEGRLRIVQAEVVLADIDRLVEMGARHVTFGDPDFLNGVKHSMRIVRRMHENHPDLTFDFTAKIEHLLEHRDLLPELSELGCLFIVSAVESLNDRILGYLRKDHTREDVRRAVQLTRSAGIAIRPSLLSFTPWTTVEDYLDVLDFVEWQGLIYHVDPVQYAIRLLLPPGSWLLDLPEMRPYVGPLERENFAYHWEHPDPRLDRLHRDVTALVEQDSADGVDIALTFARVRELARDLAGTSGLPTDSEAVRQPRTPRLTESWFCCAEPTGDQCLAVTERAVAP